MLEPAGQAGVAWGQVKELELNISQAESKSSVAIDTPKRLSADKDGILGDLRQERTPCLPSSPPRWRSPPCHQALDVCLPAGTQSEELGSSGSCAKSSG